MPWWDQHSDMLSGPTMKPQQAQMPQSGGTMAGGWPTMNYSTAGAPQQAQMPQSGGTMAGGWPTMNYSTAGAPQQAEMPEGSGGGSFGAAMGDPNAWGSGPTNWTAPGAASGSGGWDGSKFVSGPAFQAPSPFNPGANYIPRDITSQPLTGSNVSVPDAYKSQQFAMPDRFVAPTAASMQQDPGYQFRLQQGNQALLQSKAAQGLIGAGTGQALADYNQQAASQEYGNVYARARGEHETAFNQAIGANAQNNATAAQAYGLTSQYQGQAQQANQQNQYNVGAANQQNAYQVQAQNAANAAQAHGMNVSSNMNAAQMNFSNALGAHQANQGNALNAWQANTGAQLGQGQLNATNAANQNSYAAAMANVGLGYTQAANQYNLGMANVGLGYAGVGQAGAAAGNAYDLGMGHLGLDWANYGLNAQQQDWAQGYALSNMGLNAAGQQAGYGANYAGNAGNYYTGAGNAKAAGQVGSANAWTGALGGVANAATGGLGTYYANQRRPNQYQPAAQDYYGMGNIGG